MTLTVKPTVQCNMGCHYCYEADIRHTGNAKRPYDLEAIKAQISRQWHIDRSKPTMHGGEFLLLPKADAEELFKLSFELAGESSVQTNGSLIDDDWIDMFRRYNVTVGISMDGPGPLNRARWMGSAEKTDATTVQTMENIRRMRAVKIPVSMIVVLTRLHVTTPGAMQLLKDWLLELLAMGVTGGRINHVEVDHEHLRTEYELTEDELTAIFLDLGHFMFTTPGLYWEPFRDIQDMLLGLSVGTCVYTKCDPLATDGERGIKSDGSIGNCLKTAKEGIEYQRAADGEHWERYDLLAKTPQELGGCAGCRYWKVCYGHCPAEAIDGDYRNRSRYCRAHYALFDFVETRMKIMFPNLRTVCDFNVLQPDDYALRQRSKSTFEAFSLMSRVGCWAPSVYRGNAWKYPKNPNTPFFPNGVTPAADFLTASMPGDEEHADAAHGDVAHGDHSDCSMPADAGTPQVNPLAWSRVEGQA